MPTFTPCSDASFRLKNIRLPRILNKVGVPIVDKIEDPSTVGMLTPSFNMLRAALDIALKGQGSEYNEEYE